jgi:hypothetical protein
MRDPLDMDEGHALADKISDKIALLRAIAVETPPAEFSPALRHWTATGLPSALIASLRSHLAAQDVSEVVALDDDGTAWSCPIAEAFDSQSAVWTAPGEMWFVWFQGPGEIVGFGDIFDGFDPDN